MGQLGVQVLFSVHLSPPESVEVVLPVARLVDTLGHPVFAFTELGEASMIPVPATNNTANPVMYVW